MCLRNSQRFRLPEKKASTHNKNHKERENREEVDDMNEGETKNRNNQNIYVVHILLMRSIRSININQKNTVMKKKKKKNTLIVCWSPINFHSVSSGSYDKVLNGFVISFVTIWLFIHVEWDSCISFCGLHLSMLFPSKSIELSTQLWKRDHCMCCNIDTDTLILMFRSANSVDTSSYALQQQQHHNQWYCCCKCICSQCIWMSIQR